MHVDEMEATCNLQNVSCQLNRSGSAAVAATALHLMLCSNAKSLCWTLCRADAQPVVFHSYIQLAVPV
jgi:hypothetical protein